LAEASHVRAGEGQLLEYEKARGTAIREHSEPKSVDAIVDHPISIRGAN
jgi:hypothetical protein